MSDRKWKGNPELEPFLVPVDALKRNERNARKHGPKSVQSVAKSLEDHGQQELLTVADDMTLLAGEGRLLAAMSLGWTHLAVVRSDLKKRADQMLYALRSNRTAELSNWDLEELAKQLQELSKGMDLSTTGMWEPYELDPLLAIDWTPPASTPGDPTSTSVGGSADMASPIKVTVEQRQVFARALESLLDKIEADEGTRPEDMTEGRALELICADWLSGQ